MANESCLGLFSFCRRPAVEKNLFTSQCLTEFCEGILPAFTRGVKIATKSSFDQRESLDNSVLNVYGYCSRPSMPAAGAARGSGDGGGNPLDLDNATKNG